MRRLFVAIATAVLGLAAAVPSFSADSGTVTATVTGSAPCITLSFSTLDFGTLPFNTSGAALSGTVTNPGSYTNCSVQSEKILLRGTDASGAGGAAWSLVPGITTGTCPLNVFLSGLSIPGIQYPLQKTDQEIQTAAASATTPIAYINLAMPCTGSSGVGIAMSWQYIFTATF